VANQLRGSTWNVEPDALGYRLRHRGRIVALGQRLVAAVVLEPWHTTPYTPEWAGMLLINAGRTTMNNPITASQTMIRPAVTIATRMNMFLAPL
jgi:hypothetical protein